MTRTNIQPAAEPAPISYQELNPREYFNYVARLLDEGRLMAKTAPMYAKVIPGLRIQTLDDRGATETDKTYPSQFAIVIDPQALRNKARKQMIGDHLVDPGSAQKFIQTADETEMVEAILDDIAVQYGKKIIDRQELNTPDYHGPDVWTNDLKKFEAGYVKDAEIPYLYHPNRENDNDLRVMLQVDTSINWIASWGPFPVAGGLTNVFGQVVNGSIAAYPKDIPALTEAHIQVQAQLDGLREQKLSEEEFAAKADEIISTSFLKKDDSGNTVAVFDIYGTKPGFEAQNYTPV